MSAILHHTDTVRRPTLCHISYNDTWQPCTFILFFVLFIRLIFFLGIGRNATTMFLKLLLIFFKIVIISVTLHRTDIFCCIDYSTWHTLPTLIVFAWYHIDSAYSISATFCGTSVGDWLPQYYLTTVSVLIRVPGRWTKYVLHSCSYLTVGELWVVHHDAGPTCRGVRLWNTVYHLRLWVHGLTVSQHPHCGASSASTEDH